MSSGIRVDMRSAAHHVYAQLEGPGQALAHPVHLETRSAAHH
jgi:hypothetical protein